MRLRDVSLARRARLLVLTLTLSGAALVIPGSSGAQTEKVYRIGYLQTSTRAQQAHLVKAFEDGLRDLGYVAGRNVVIEYRFADGKLERLPQLAEELVRLKVDLIVTGINPNTIAAKRATTTIPIVMATSIDPGRARCSRPPAPCTSTCATRSLSME